MPWINHPACTEKVSVIRWLKWRLSERLFDWSRDLERDALYPNCDACGQPRKRGDHSGCLELPF